jgi:hypothetical protein
VDPVALLYESIGGFFYLENRFLDISYLESMIVAIMEV